ncbi:intracellular growth locus iglB [Candidatus Francisella endociliophora]|uniref:Intracellular growth locus iglB n=1 Tax=Candidatus Francisella endociliophora TaxID=653937 RepID=A0A097EPV9_9GAMM|nr:type VI secretion system contractile sheath large subunit [Francisella sp. FSC1006]AIT09603.1 intracellular growth locus iglB [Francisella sp. FSC1006]
MTTQASLSDQLLDNFKSSDSISEVISNIDFNVSNDSTKVLDITENYNARNLMALSLILANNDEVNNYNQKYVQKVISMIDKLIELQVNTIIANTEFKSLEQEWLKIQELCKDDYDGVEIGILDVKKEELQYDFERNLYDISNSDFFKKVYVAEFDQYGGEPYGAILGLYDFENSEDDITWLTGMGMVAKNSHAPFVASIDKSFFGVNDISEITQIKSFETLLEHPKYKNWNDFRKLDEAAYIGLTVGDFMLRQPYHPDNNPVQHKLMKSFSELVDYQENNSYLWGSSSIQLVKNMMRSYDKTRWFQYIRGVESGGHVSNLVSCVYDNRGVLETKPPLNVLFADYMELSLANVGFIPFVGEKGTSSACFFSVNSAKKVDEFVDDFDSANSRLIANLSYTLCISRISHFIKCVIRDKIGSVVGTEQIHGIISDWISEYVTTVYQPTPLEMARYPFRNVNIDVKTIPGKPGWFSCKINVIPHIQFEGMDTTMTIDTRLEPALFGSAEQ